MEAEPLAGAVEAEADSLAQQDESAAAAAAAAQQAEGEEETVFAVAPTLKGTANVSELLAQDAEDESLVRYKAALLGSAALGDLGDVSDPRKVVLTQFVLAFEPSQGFTDLVFDLDAKGLEGLARDGITMKEGARFKFKISFRVQHEIVVGLKFINSVSKLLFTEKEELMIGSYPPSSAPFTFEFPKWDYNSAPSGMMYRGTYKVKNSFYFNGNELLASFEYPLRIVK